MTAESTGLRIADEHEVLRQSDKTSYLVSRRDWRRLRKMMNNCSPGETSFYEGAGWALVGIAGSAATSLIGFSISAPSSLDGWVKPTHWAVLVGAIILAFALLRLARDKRSNATMNIKAVCEEFDEIEAGYPLLRSRRHDSQP